ncbi:SLC8A3 (predicted) [Pycnogonum litorale]
MAASRILSRFLSVTFVIILCLDSIRAKKKGDDSSSSTECKDGLILYVWQPVRNISTGDMIARAVVYFVGLVYMFVGVSIIADRFMASIEVITSKEKQIVIKKPNGESQTVNVRIWNETVSNLTLMALGSSAPEIMLSVIEVYAQDFNAGELGPGTIVGSAAFNMFIIISICIYVIPNSETRRIKHLRVFFITATWSVFAYIWLFLILCVISRGVVEIWESIVTLLFFPATVITAYIADRRLLIYKYLHKKYRMNKRGVIIEGEGDVELTNAVNKSNDADGGLKIFEEENLSEEFREFEEHRREYISLLRELRSKHPDEGMNVIEQMAREEILVKGPKSRAYYRIQATRKLTGGGNLVKRKIDRRGTSAKEEMDKKKEEEQIMKIFFNPGHYTVMENVGTFEVKVVREGGDNNTTVYVDYRTEDGTANAHSDYEPTEGTLVFYPGETFKTFSIAVIDDDVFEEDEHFYVRLSNLRYGGRDGVVHVVNGVIGQRGTSSYPIQLAPPATATIMILDDDHSGLFNIMDKELEISESVGEYPVKVNRSSGARGRVIVPWRTIDGTAIGNRDYEIGYGELIFENNETSKDINIHVIDDETYEKDIYFYLELGEPKLFKADNDTDSGTSVDVANNHDLTEQEKIALLGRPRLGDISKCHIRVKESKEFKSTVDKLIARANTSIMVGTSSWREQFIDAITVNADDDDEGDEGSDVGQKQPSCSDYVIHFITIFWKVLFAFVPPTNFGGGWPCFTVSILVIGMLTAIIGDLASHVGCTIGLKDAVTAIAFVALGTSIPDYWGGWACFCISIVCIGVLTAFIGDLASHFGCTIGLNDAVTAISLVALGTSVPDTFASKVAAVNDKYADSSIGNVTGSNAVNVFLGIGLAWSMASIHKYWKHNEYFRVDPGSLGFSVTIFCVGAVICMVVLLLRRSALVGGELGGPTKYRVPTVALFVSMWLFYIIMSSLESYGKIKGF